MKNIFNKIIISKPLIIIVFLALISGLFKDILFFLTVIVIHEIGHIIISIYYNWNIINIKFGICGGFITYDETLEKTLKEELLISTAGILFQIIFEIAIMILIKINLINIRDYNLISKYNNAILIFNILPIYPLDGSKILSILLNRLMAYKKVLKIIFYVSVTCIISIIFLILRINLKIEYSYLLILSFLISSLISYYNEIPYIFNKFLYERYNNRVYNNKRIYIKGNNVNKMRKGYNHFFIFNNKYISEKKILSNRFKNMIF